jgi:dCMP deaminase
MTKLNEKWDSRFIDLAKHIAGWSKDPSSQIGAVIVAPMTRKILSLGYNGFLTGIADTETRLKNRDEKHKLVIHAEMNAIYNALSTSTPLAGAVLYVSGLPVCSECAKAIIQVGIAEVVADFDVDNPRVKQWDASTKLSEQFFAEAGINYLRSTKEVL